MYNVSANFHSLAIADSPKTRCRIYFITDAVNCWDDNAVQTNGTLLVGAAGDTDSNGRIGQGGVTVTEIFNKDKNLTLGGTVSYQIGMTLVNSDGALNNFAFGRCKVYLDVYDDAYSTWLPCPLGVFRIELPVKRKVQLISCTGYDQMQVLNAIADTWWNGLNFTGGLTIESILNSMVTQLGLHLSATSSTNMVNKTLSFTTPPIDSVERTYRDILGWIAEATGTVAHFNRDGELDMRPYLTPQIGGNNIVIDTDTTGNQCLSIDIAEYSVSQIDALTIKLTTADQGVTVGSGENVYTIMDNPFLYGPDVATIQSKLTPIYNRLNAYATYSPISTRLIYDWSIEAGDILYIINNSTTYKMPIFQQKIAWRGGYVTSELISSGDTVRPQVSSSERETYRYNVEMATKVGDSEIISKINQTAEQIQIQASKVNLTGYITATNLATAGQTVINGGNITTGEISADRINGGSLNIGGSGNSRGIIRVYDSSDNLSGQWNNNALAQKITYQHETYTNEVNNIVQRGIRVTDTPSGGSARSCIDLLAYPVPGDQNLYGSLYLSAAAGANGSVRLISNPNDSFISLENLGYGANIHASKQNGASRLELKGDAKTIYLDTANGTNLYDTTVNGVLDVTQRRCYATLSSPGWYRVLSYKTGDADRSAGHPSFIANLSITRYSSTQVGEIHSIRLFVNYNKNVNFVDEQSQSSSQIIDKIRYTINGGNAYVDIHYNINGGNGVCVNFDVDIHSNLQGYFTAESLQAVADTPSGELTTYDFAENTEAVGTVVGASGFTPGEIDVKRSGRVVYAHFYVQNVSIAANTETLIGTLSGVPLPNKNIRWLAGGGAHAYDTVTPVYAYLGSSGNIYVTSPSAISAVNITISYIV